MDVPVVDTSTEGQNALAFFFMAAAAVLTHVYYSRPQRLQGPPDEPPPPLRRSKRIWSRQWLLRRSQHGDFDHLLRELHREDPKGFKNFLRISPDLFLEMVERLAPRLTKTTTRLRFPLAVGFKLAVTLRHLATGSSYITLSYTFRVSKSAICRFVPEVCQAIIDVYKDEVMKCPRSPEEWKKVAEDFSKRWQYHNCCGALDGTHIPIQKPSHGGSLYYNYKKFHSIVLMAVADANYKFIYVDVGAEGSAGDGGTWYRTTLHEAIEDHRAGFPDASPLPNATTPIPFHLVGDDAFAMKTWLMKPYSHHSQVPQERIFNYRLSRARRVVENAFGLMQTKLRVFANTMLQKPNNVRTLTMCGCVLHNLLLDRFPFANNAVDYEDDHHNLIPGLWREEPNTMARLQHTRARNTTQQIKAMRDHLAQYYSSGPGAVPWQERMVYPRGRPND